jgi:hypothetical protein
MRADYVERFNRDWNSGLKRLVSKGAWFQRAAYPYLTTITCAGHATISTGAYPHTHGIFQNAWWDRDTKKQVTCTDDALATDVGYGAPVTGGDSGRLLQIPTFADQMRTARGAPRPGTPAAPERTMPAGRRRCSDVVGRIGRQLGHIVQAGPHRSRR